MSIENDPDLALVRKLHLELNGSGRRTSRGAAQPPAKRIKREAATGNSEGGTDVKETPSRSQSGSESRSGQKALKKEGALKRLVKKQPDTVNTQQIQHPAIDIAVAYAEEEGGGADIVRKEALEPQYSTKAVEDKQGRRSGDGDVGSRMETMIPDLTSDVVLSTQESAGDRAIAAAMRDASSANPRIKCFYQGCPYGVSLDHSSCSSRGALHQALKDALASVIDLGPMNEMDIFVYDGDGKQVLCKAEAADVTYSNTMREAKRIYVACPSQA